MINVRDARKSEKKWGNQSLQKVVNLQNLQQQKHQNVNVKIFIDACVEIVLIGHRKVINGTL